MKMSMSRALCVVLIVYAAGVTMIMAYAGAQAFIRHRQIGEFKLQFRNAAATIRQHLTPDVLSELGCEINSVGPYSYRATLSPKEAERARVVLTTLLDYSDFCPCGALLEENRIAPTCWLSFFQGNKNRSGQSLVSLEVYEEGPYAVVVASPFLREQRPIAINMDYSVYGAFKELIGMVKANRQRASEQGR